MLIHFFDHCPNWVGLDCHSIYMAETTCVPCVTRLVDRGLLSEADAAAMRYFIKRDRDAHDDEQLAEWDAIDRAERATTEMGLLR